mgnify:CR=1 FL=1
MDEYIKREDAISAVCSGCNLEFSDRACEPPDCEIRHAINAVPTADVVPVVRCKNCEHGQFMPSCSMYLCRCTGGKLRYADDYCNYGERKEQE